MAENKFKVFGESTTNILSDDSFSTDSEVTNGFQKNTTINSNTMNAILRQCSLISTAIADDIVSKESIDISPNMDYSTLKTKYSNYMDYKTKLGLNDLTSGISTWDSSTKKFNVKNESTLNVASATNVTTNIGGNAISSIFETDGTTTKNSTNVTTTINGKKISDIFESDGVRVKNATNATNAINSTNATNATNSETTNKLSNFNNSSSGNKVEFSFGESSNKTTFTHTIPTVTSVQNSNNAINVTSTIDGKLLSDIFETDKKTVKEATHSKNADLAAKSTTSDSSTNVTTSINDIAISDIFENNGSTVKKATNSDSSEKVTKYIGEQLISDIFESNSTKVKNSTNSTYSTYSTNIKGGSVGDIPYQTKSNETNFKKESELNVASAKKLDASTIIEIDSSNSALTASNAITKPGLYSITICLKENENIGNNVLFSIYSLGMNNNVSYVDYNRTSEKHITIQYVSGAGRMFIRENENTSTNYKFLEVRLITEY